MAEFPAFLASYDDLEVHISEYFRDLTNTERGNRFARFTAQLVPFVHEFREFGEARLSEKQTHDGGVDVTSVDPLGDGSRLYLQAKLHISGKEELDTIVSKFHAFENEFLSTKAQGSLFDQANEKPPLVFGIVTTSRVEGIRRRYEQSTLASRAYYDKFLAENRLHFVDGTKILQILQTGYEKTYEVPSKIQLKFKGPFIRSENVRLGFLPAASLIDLYQRHGDALFFENIRDYLGPTSGRVAPDQATVNEEIVNTITNSAERLLELNNGITLKARVVQEASVDELLLLDASIVNGCQTTMSLVGTRRPPDTCIVQVKVVESQNAWDIAKAANFQNTVDKIDLDLARYLRPQVVRKAASAAGVEVADAIPTSVVSLLGNFYQDKVQYEEVRHLYIGMMSFTPNNIGDGLYTKLRADLISEFAKDPVTQEALLQTLFRVVKATRDAIQRCNEMFGDEDYMKPFSRFFKESKPQYRIFLAVLTLCAVLGVDISARHDDTQEEMLRMRDFVRSVEKLLAQDSEEFVRGYAMAITTVASEARLASDDDRMVRQYLINTLRRGFASAYATLRMQIDVNKKLARTSP